MLMKDDKKSMATLIVAKMKSPNSDEQLKSNEKDGAEQEQDEYSMAADEILAAVESKDSKQLAEALKSFVTICMNSEEEEE